MMVVMVVVVVKRLVGGGGDRGKKGKCNDDGLAGLGAGRVYGNPVR